MKKLLVVTGGTRGIGKEIIGKFLDNGFDAVTCARSALDLGKLRDDFSDKGSVYTYEADLSRKDQVGSFAQYISGMNRPVDVLVNNAGYFMPGEISTEPDGILEDMMGANLYSAYYLIRSLVDRMKQNRSGHIFNICSIASLKAYPNGGSYAVTKSALLGLSRCLREELKGFDIRVTAVMPGATRTASWDGADLPDDRFMRPEDVAEMIFACYAISRRSVVEEIIMRPQLGDI